MADERLRTKRELKRLFTNLKRKGISDDMISILIDTLWRDRANLRTSGFFHAGAYDAQFSFNVETRIFTIVPFDPLVEGFEPRYSIFSWSNLAVHHRIFKPLEIEIPNEEGLFCVYFDKETDPGTSQVLAFKKNPTTEELEIIYTSKVLISCFYWDAANNEILHFGNDKHGSEWNPHLHWFIHTTQGAKRKSGLQFEGYLLNGDGTLNDHAKFNITGGVMLHDDFEMSIPSSGNTIPVLYSFGTLPRFLANNGYAFAGSGRVYFNSGQISLVQADTDNFVLYHIFATNEILTESRKIISVMGTAQYTTLADAYQGVAAELNGISTYIPHRGKCYLGSIVIQTSDDYTNDVKARIVAFTGNESHPPVTIAPGSKPYLYINAKQELQIFVDALPAGEASAYDWNIHGPEQIIGSLPEPENITVTTDGTGTIDETMPAGTYAIVAVNAAGETLPVNVPEIVILVDTTYVNVDFDTVEGATGYRVYNVATGDYAALLTSLWFYHITTPATPGTLPVANTAYITQTPFTIEDGDTVEVVGEGIDVETEVDELDSTIKRILLKKQQSSWSVTDENSPNFIPGKPESFDGSEVELSTSGGYIVWRYVGDVDWINLLEITTLAGEPGGDGDDGREVELSTSSGYIVWRYVGDVDWITLLEIATLAGEPGGDGDDGREIELQENAGWVEWRYVGDATWTQLYEIPEGGTSGASVIQVTGTLVVANWSADGSLFKYVLSNASITATSSVEVIPANSSYDVLIEAQPLPETESAAGSVSVWAKAIPSVDIPVTINITEVV